MYHVMYHVMHHAMYRVMYQVMYHVMYPCRVSCHASCHVRPSSARRSSPSYERLVVTYNCAASDKKNHVSVPCLVQIGGEAPAQRLSPISGNYRQYIYAIYINIYI